MSKWIAREASDLLPGAIVEKCYELAEVGCGGNRETDRESSRRTRVYGAWMEVLSYTPLLVLGSELLNGERESAVLAATGLAFFVLRYAGNAIVEDAIEIARSGIKS